MKLNKIISSALALVISFGVVSAVLPTRVEAAYSPSVSSDSIYTLEEIQAIVESNYYVKDNQDSLKFDSAEEKLEYEIEKGYIDFVKSKTGDHTIYVNRYTGVLYYKNTKTGEILTSNPYDLSAVSSIDVQTDLLSQIKISFKENANATSGGTYSSAQWAAEYAQIKVSAIAGGLRVNYTLGDTSTRFLLPGQICADDYDKKIMTPMLTYYQNLLIEYLGEEITEEEYNFFYADTYGGIFIRNADKNHMINFEAVREYLNATARVYRRVYPNAYGFERKALESVAGNIQLMLLKYLSPEEPKSFLDENDNPCEEYYYEFTDINSISTKRQCSNIIRTYCPEYTMQQLLLDEQRINYQNKMDQKPVFRCSIEYTFNEDESLSVRLPANSIVFDETVYNLTSISFLPYFGAGDLKEDGYVFIPDGSGSIVDFEDFYNNEQKQNVSLSLNMYGYDYCYSMLDPAGAHREQITMPVYGVVYNSVTNPETAAISGNAKQKTGYFAILEEGSTLASLQMEFGGVVHPFANVYTYFKPFPSDEYDLSDTISVGGAKTYTIVSESKYSDSYVTRYVMLSDGAAATAVGSDFTYASYTGMATYYRNYLEKNGAITPMLEAEEDLPLYIEAFGSMEVMKRILTFPVTVSIPLTTFEDVTTMYDTLADAKNVLLKKAEEYDALAKKAAEAENLTLEATYKDKADSYRALSEKVYNITNINFKLTGFSNGGMYYTYPTKIKWEKSCGGKAGFKSLLDDVKERQDKGLNFNVYPEFDFQYINNTAPFDGISNKGNVSKMVDNRYASKQELNSILGEFEPIFAMVISPDALDNLYTKFLKKYSKYDITNISVSTLGSDLNSNFNSKNPINREESSSYIVSLLDRMVNENDMSVMMSRGNIYAVKYADHIIDISTDSSHFAYSSYTIPFIGMVLHGYVNYAGAALNYSGSPDYDILRAIENGASMYYILSYQNTEAMKDDQVLNKYYGVSYTNWYDKLVENYAVLNEAIGKYQKWNIIDHKTILAERLIDDDESAANYASLRDEIFDLVKEQLDTKIDEAYESMFGDEANNGRGVKVVLDVDAILSQATELINTTLDELKASDLDERLAELKAAYEEEYQGTDNSMVVNFSAIEYKSKYSYITDSHATDENYVYTDFTVDNNLVTMVTYENRETGEQVVFLINYNIYSVKITLEDGTVHELGKYDYEPIRIGGDVNNG